MTERATTAGVQLANALPDPDLLAGAYALTRRALADKVSPDHRDSLAALAGVATGALAAYFLVVTAALFTLAILPHQSRHQIRYP